MPNEIYSAAEEKRRNDITQLVLTIQRRDDPSQNRQLIKFMKNDLINRFRPFTVFGSRDQFYFLEKVLDSFTQRHLELATKPRKRKLSYLYRFSPEENEDFVSYLFGLLKKPQNVYEPHATWLVEQIQAGKDEEENKGRLVELLYPFISLIAYKSMHNHHYQIFDIEDAIAYQVERLLSHGREGWTGKNNKHYNSWLYEFDPEMTHDFCTYFSARLHAQFLTWCRRMDGVQAFREEVSENRTEGGIVKSKARIYYKTVETSMDASDSDREEKAFESSLISIRASQSADEKLRIQEEQKRDELMQKKEADAVALLFLQFFDLVDGLDEDRCGPRSVTERGILSYHLKFSTGIWNRLRRDGCRDEQKDFNRYAKERACSFRQLAGQLWEQPLLRAASKQSRDYRRLFRRDYAYLNHLTRRICISGLKDAPYLEEKKDIENKAPGWAKTVERRIKKDYQTMIVDQFKKIRRKLYDEIQ